MEYKPSPYVVSSTRNPNRKTQSDLQDTTGLIMNMLAGPNPGDDALFYKRLEDAKGSQLANRGLTSTLNARDLIATNPDFINQIISTLGIDPTTMDKGRMGDFGTYAAQTKDPHLIAQSLSQFGRGSAATAKEAEALAQSKLMNPELLQNLRLTGDNLRSTGAYTDQLTFNAEDLALEREALNQQDLLIKAAQKRKIDQETANLLAGMGLETTESGADVGLKEAQTEQVTTLTPKKEALLEAQAKVPTAQAAAIEGESAETVKLLQQKVVKEQAATWVQRAQERAIRTGTRNKDAESGQKILQMQAQTGVFGAQADAIVAAIANKNYESALKGMKTATEAMVTLQLGDAKRDEIAQQIKVLKQEVLNLQAEQGNKNNESGARVNLIDGKGELVDEEITTEQVLRPKQAELLDAKTDWWRTRGESEMANILGLTTGGKPGKKTGTSQFDYRKTKTATEMNYNIEDVGKKYLMEEGKESTEKFFGMFGDEEVPEKATYLWPDDDKVIRAILTPTLQQGQAEQKAAIAQARAKLSEFGKDDPKEIHAIIKSIMQVSPSK